MAILALSDLIRNTTSAFSVGSSFYSGNRIITTQADTPSAIDVGKLLSTTNTGDITITLESAGFSFLDKFDVLSNSAGPVTFVAGVGVVFLPEGQQKLKSNGSGATIVYLGTNVFWIGGGIKSAPLNRWNSAVVNCSNMTFEQRFTIAAVGILPTNIVDIKIAPGNDLDENEPTGLKISAMDAVAGTDNFILNIESTDPLNGPINILYKVAE